MLAWVSQAMRKVTGSLSKSQCTVVFLNQLRSKIGVIYGSPEVTSGKRERASNCVDSMRTKPFWARGTVCRIVARTEAQC